MEKHKAAVGFEIFELAKLFDRSDGFGGGTRVVGDLPDDIRSGEMSILQHHENGMTKATYTRKRIKFLVVMNTREYMAKIIDNLHEVKNRPHWHDRWNPSEVGFDERPLLKIARVLKSRLRTEEEKKQWELFYGGIE